jgi:hypothetical protein
VLHRRESASAGTKTGFNSGRHGVPSIAATPCNEAAAFKKAKLLAFLIECARRLQVTAEAAGRE